MAKRYDPILCMMVDEPTKAQDAMPSDLKKAGYEVGTVEKYGSTYYTLVYNGKVISTSPTEANIVEKAKKHYANRHTKAQDAGFVLRHKNGQYMSSAGRTNEKAKAKVFSSKREAEAYKGDYVVSSTDPDYHNWSVVAVDSASTLDKAIKTCDGMFQQIFGKYSSAAKQHYDRAVKELDSFKGEIKDYLTLAGKWEMQIRNDLTRIDEAYNTAGNDYYAARREIQETMDSLTQVMLRKAREKRK